MILGVFAALGRYFRAVGYLFTGRIDEARRALMVDPNVVRATYDEIHRDHVNRILEFRRALATMIAQQEKKTAQKATLEEECAKLEALRAGALAKGKKRTDTLQKAGKTAEEIQHDEDFVKCQAAFKDFGSTLAEKRGRIEDLTAGITQDGERIRQLTLQLNEMMRELDKIKVEGAETIADLIAAREEKAVSDLISGLSRDGTAERRAELRDLRAHAKAEARVARTTAGMDTKAAEADFLDYARTSEANDEFAQLVGLAGKTDAKAAGGTDVAAPVAEKATGGGGLPE